MAQSTWHKVTDPAVFHERSVPFFSQSEAIYNLPLGIASRLKSNPKVFGDDFYLFLLTEDSEPSSLVKGAVWWTPPFPIGFTRLSGSDVDLFFETQKLDSQPDSLVGPPETVAKFASKLGHKWANFPAGFDIQEQGIYSLSKLTDAFKDVDGQASVAIERDYELVLSWSEKFIVDCKSVRPRNFESSVREAIAAGSRVLWTTSDNVVSMAGTAGLTPNGARIAWVYTPPELRGRGYGGAVTRFLSNLQLSDGKKFCFLYTDMANPTSNSIYKKLGYEFVGWSQHVLLQ